MTASRPPLRIAIAIFRLAPAGGLEQHALRLADLLAGRGHLVTILTTRSPAVPAPSGVAIEIVPARGRTNHGRLAAFAEDVALAAAGRFDRSVAGGRFDRTVAFHAIPGFDFVFCADPSRARPGPLRAMLPRYRTYANLERQAFGPASRTTVLCLSSAQHDAIARNDRTPHERLILLPPTVERRVDAGPASRSDRASARKSLSVENDGPVWLWMGLQPKTKGLDRALAALAAVPGARLIVTGLDPASHSGAGAQRLAERLGVEGRVRRLGFCTESELRQAKAAADLLVHPARADVTGTVILEAMAAGLPVIATGVCGYGEHVRRADAGMVLAEPFRSADLQHALAAATPERLAAWSSNALAYASRDDLYNGLERAADVIQAAPGMAPAGHIA